MSKREAALAVAVFVVVGVAARVLPHLPNFAPITATALFTGAHMSRRAGLVALLAVLLLSDYVLLYVSPFAGVHFDRLYAPWELWHSTLPYIYASFGLSAAAGWLLKRHRQPAFVLATAAFCSVQFFLITNAGVWLAGAYDRGVEGLWQSYVAGLPFFRGTLLGDLFYTAAFFGAYDLLRRGVARGREALPRRAV